MPCVYPGDDGYIHYCGPNGEEYYVGDHVATPEQTRAIEKEKADRKARGLPPKKWKMVKTDLDWETRLPLAP
jgi:hypothetical protein